MSRLIDADELNDYMMDTYGGGITDNTVIFYGDVLTIINEAPTIDAVPVVRCKDCLFSEERYGHLTCINGMSYRNTWNKPYDFCSYGERAEG